MIQENDFCNDLSQLGKPAELLEGKMLLVDKPLDWTSFDVVKKIRAKLQHGLKIKKIKVGHAGTLDPLASGLVIVCIGKATKNIDALMGWSKTYEAKVKFGLTTPSFDLETQPNHTFPTEHIDEDKIREALKSFPGEQLQVPPQYSAIKIEGKRAYDMVRDGKTFEMNARSVTFHNVDLMGFESMEATIRIVCSKGTYIRSFARDLGIAVGSGGVLTGLRRTAIGPAKVENALSIDDIVRQVDTLKENFTPS
ncbi:MAG: tRNA pseudouridine(55) synthase TruB [Bacteroidota bacterium]